MKKNKIWLKFNIATMAGTTPYGEIKDGALEVKDGRIIWIGESKDLTKEQIARSEIIKGNGEWITPGLIDCHTHLIYAGNRINEFEMRYKGVTYETIARMGGGIISTVNKTRGASEIELFQSAKKRLKTLLYDGVTTVEIKSGYGLDTETELKMLNVAKKLEKNLRITIQKTYMGAHTIPPEFKGKENEYVDLVCQNIEKFKKLGLIDAVDVFCEKIAFNIEQTEKILFCASKLGIPVKVHTQQLSDMGAVELALKYNALSADHLEYLSEKGVKVLAQAETVAVLLPGASYFLQEKQKPPVAALRKYGVPIAVSTDLNPGTSPVNSLLAVMNMACVIFGLTPEETLRGVTRNAAKALGYWDIGTLEFGKIADFVVWEISHPAELSYGIGMHPRKKVIRRGKVYDN